MDLSKFIEWIKLSPRYIFPFLIISGFFLFAPEHVLSIFGLSTFTTQYKPIIGIIFLFSSALLLSHWFIEIWKWLVKGIKNTRAKKNFKHKLHQLTAAEKLILRDYLRNNTKTQYYSMTNGIVSGLELEGILYKASNIGHVYKFAFNIQPWVWNYLKKHPETLEE